MAICLYRVDNGRYERIGQGDHLHLAVTADII